jgi:hypothetical protein
MAEAAGYAARRVLATALAVTAKKAVAEAVCPARYHRVLTLKLTAAQELRGAGCHGDAYELDAGQGRWTPPIGGLTEYQLS